MVRIAHVAPGSIAEELELRIGTRIIRINGTRVRDGIDFTYLQSEAHLEIEVRHPDGDARIYEIDREPGQSLGIVPAPDTVRECANECVFCFIDGNPTNVRQSLWLRDDDFRLSFTYGSYVTLTNLGPKGFQRLIDQRISPLYVSVHATDPDVRERLLKNRRAGLIMDQLRALTEAGLNVHTQVVLCPGWNDAAHLDRTIEDLWSLGGNVLTLSVVPVGLTRYNLGKPVRLLTAEEASRAIDQVDRARAEALVPRGKGWCYAADELYLIAGRPVPEAEYYDDWPLTENGVGAVRRFTDDLDTSLDRLPEVEFRRVRLVTGASMAPFIGRRAGSIGERVGVPVEVVEVENEFFGPSVTVAGLLAGQDIARTLGESGEGDLVLIPGEALNRDGQFIDSMTLEHLRLAAGGARVVPAPSIAEGLRAGAAA